jgi:hypothetical protein
VRDQEIAVLSTTGQAKQPPDATPDSQPPAISRNGLSGCRLPFNPIATGCLAVKFIRNPPAALVRFQCEQVDVPRIARCIVGRALPARAALERAVSSLAAGEIQLIRTYQLAFVSAQAKPVHPSLPPLNGTSARLHVGTTSVIGGWLRVGSEATVKVLVKTYALLLGPLW